MVRVLPAVARALLATVGLDPTSARTAEHHELPGVTATLSAAGTVQLTSSRNVIGFLAGAAMSSLKRPQRVWSAGIGFAFRQPPQANS